MKKLVEKIFAKIQKKNDFIQTVPMSTAHSPRARRAAEKFQHCLEEGAAAMTQLDAILKSPPDENIDKSKHLYVKLSYHWLNNGNPVTVIFDREIPTHAYFEEPEIAVDKRAQ